MGEVRGGPLGWCDDSDSAVDEANEHISFDFPITVPPDRRTEKKEFFLVKGQSKSRNDSQTASHALLHQSRPATASCGKLERRRHKGASVSTVASNNDAQNANLAKQSPILTLGSSS